MPGLPYVVVDEDGLIRSPDKTRQEERGEQRDAIVELCGRACEPEFVEEPVDVEERRREFIQDEAEAVVVGERFLAAVSFTVPYPTDLTEFQKNRSDNNSQIRYK
jgi:hypothetical protein